MLYDAVINAGLPANEDVFIADKFVCSWGDASLPPLN